MWLNAVISRRALGGRACIPIRVMLFAVSAGNVLLERRDGALRLPETWLEEGETICEAARRYAAGIASDPSSVKPVAVVWFTEDTSEGYTIVFAVEVFMDSEPRDQKRYIMLNVGDAVKLVDEPLHRRFLETMYLFKPRPLLVCNPP